MKVTLSRATSALTSKSQAVIKLMLGYSADLVKKLQAAGTYDGMQFIAGLSRNIVLKTVKDAARAGVFGTKANWAHSDFFDQFPVSSDESWAEFLLALVFDPANDREKKAIYDRLVSMNRNAGKTASSSVTTAFFGKIREELRKHNIRKRIRQGGFTEKKMDAMPDKAREHRQNKNNPWGLNVGVSAGKAVAADFELHTEFVGEVKKLTQKLARSLQIKGFRPVPGEPSAAYAGEFWKLSLSMDDTGKALSAVTGRLSMLYPAPKGPPTLLFDWQFEGASLEEAAHNLVALYRKRGGAVRDFAKHMSQLV